MSTHPNVILLCTLTPEGLSRATMRAILANAGIADEGEDTDEIPIGYEKYHHVVMEEDYNDDWQLTSKEGDLLIFDFVTCGYGEQISWEQLAKQKDELEAWAKEVCLLQKCSYKISVTANYW